MRLTLTQSVAVVTLISVAFAPTLGAVEAPALNPITCASPASQVKVSSRSLPATTSTGKIYFKAAGQTLEYYVDMRRAGDGTMWAMIPAPLPETKSFTYRVVTTDNRGGQASSFLMTAATAASCALTLTPVEQQAASNMVIGLTNASQPAVPTGFQCRGVVSYITTLGEMRPNEECRRLVAAGAQPGAAGAPGATTGTTAGTTGGATGAGGSGAAGGATARGATGAAVALGGGEAGLGTTTIVALTAAGLVAAGIVIHRNNNNNNNNEVSRSRP